MAAVCRITEAAEGEKISSRHFRFDQMYQTALRKILSRNFLTSLPN